MSCTNGPGTCYIDLTGIGQVGATGATGAAGANGSDGVAVLFDYQDSGGSYLSTAVLGAFTAIAGAAYTIPSAELTTDGSFIEYKVVATGGTAAPNFDSLRFAINGTAITNPDASYVVSTETFHFPYTSSATVEITMRITRSSATTATITLFMQANNGASRVDLYSGAFAMNSFAASTNAITVSLYNNAANSVKLYDIKVIKYVA